MTGTEELWPKREVGRDIEKLNSILQELSPQYYAIATTVVAILVALLFYRTFFHYSHSVDRLTAGMASEQLNKKSVELWGRLRRHGFTKGTARIAGATVAVTVVVSALLGPLAASNST